jgi:6,7-dimethyl-8-ribityllumazine synthase
MQPLIAGAQRAFHEACGDDGGQMTVLECPGTWELPVTIAAMCETLDPTPDAFVALGCVIKGETSHDRWINDAVCTALANLSGEMRIPIALGVLTCDTMDQAQARAGGDRGNTGFDAMNAAIEHAVALRTIAWDRTP